jgi:hypothetical protein
MDRDPVEEKELWYLFLQSIPEVPAQPTPTREQCRGYKYMTMVQLCNIAEAHGLTRSQACNAFGGDRGKIEVPLARMASAIMIGDQLRKFVFTGSAIDYFNEMNIDW